MIGKMAIATALRGFNDLGHSVTPTLQYFGAYRHCGFISLRSPIFQI